MIEEMWDPQAGLFRARKNGVRLDVTTPFNLFPLLTGRLPREISDRLVAHLVNPAEFWARFPVPSVARNDPRYSPDTMWRGPTWINVNYLLVEGLECSGYRAVAASLRQRTLELVASGDDIYEYYNPETGLPPADAARMYGWSAALFIDLLLGGGRSREQGGN